MKSEKEIEAMLEDAEIGQEEGTKFPALTYEDGIRSALEWVLEYLDEDDKIL
jgi:hypothetical protein